MISGFELTTDKFEADLVRVTTLSQQFNSLNNSSLFIESWELFKKHRQFFLNIGTEPPFNDFVNSIKGLSKPNTEDIQEAILSWHEEEKDMSLLLSRSIGVYVKTTKTKDSLKLLEESLEIQV